MSANDTATYDVVIPTVGRASLARLVDALMTSPDGPQRAVVVDDRRVRREPLRLADSTGRVAVVASGGLGPAAARNIGFRCCTAPWVVFLDDDVELPAGWTAALKRDLASATSNVAGVSGRIVVPLDASRPPSDRERDVHGLSVAAWATADMAYRRRVLIELGGFDERFRRAYREDADLAIRMLRCGYDLRVGERSVRHPVLPAPWYVSIARQRGNLDDALLGRLHPAKWRALGGVRRGRRRWHVVATTGLLASAIARRRRPAVAAIGAATWALVTADFARRRVSAGPRDPREITAMVATSIAIPPIASALWLAGWVRARRLVPHRHDVAALLFDRDGTLIEDVPYNSNPEAVTPLHGVVEALSRARRCGVRTAIVTNQSGVGRGLIDSSAVAQVNARVEELLGPFDVVAVCSHAPDAGCDCRKPAAGLITEAASAIGVPPARCVVIGDIGSDVEAAAAAGARAVLVPNSATRVDEIAAAGHVAPDVSTAVSWALSGRL